MVALEAMRYAMIQLAEDVTTLEDCIVPNTEQIEINSVNIAINENGISENDHAINN